LNVEYTALNVTENIYSNSEAYTKFNLKSEVKNIMKKMITVKEAALVSGLSEYEIRIGLKQGRFPFYAVGNKGKKYMIDCELFLETLNKIVLNNMQTAKEEALDSKESNIVIYNNIRRVKAQ